MASNAFTDEPAILQPTNTGSVLVPPIPQPLDAETDTTPLTVPQSTIILLVPCPAIMVAPDGTFQM